MKSIIQNEKECFICGSAIVEEHHVFFGTANRKLSEKYGLKTWLCTKHHRTSLLAVHVNKKINNELKKLAQKAYMKEYNKTKEEFIKIFGKNYIKEGSMEE